MLIRSSSQDNIFLFYLVERRMDYHPPLFWAGINFGGDILLAKIYVSMRRSAPGKSG